jgi:MSHA biogenesis protein MshQ
VGAPADALGAGEDASASVKDASATDASMMDTGMTMTDMSSPDLRVVLGRRKTITIDNTRVNGNQSNFPVWIDLTDDDIAARAQANGSDIYFTASNGTPLDHQIQRWDAAGKRLHAWVRVPSLPANAPTVLYVYYGDPATAPAQDPAGVFSSSFAAVWHLDDALPASSIVDATGARAGTPSLSGATTRVAAKLGSGLSFTGSNDQITFTNNLSGNNPHTISAWVSQTGTTGSSAVVVVGSATQNQSRFLYTHFMGPAMAIGFYTNDWTTGTNLDNAGLTLVHWVFEGGNGRSRIYRNGVEIAGSPQTLNNIDTQGTTGIIGHAPEPAYGTNMGMRGIIDELRIATTARSAGWIATEYANQNSPGTFYTVGAEQLVP